MSLLNFTPIQSDYRFEINKHMITMVVMLHLLDVIKKNDELLRLESIIQLFRLICNDILQKENFLQNLVVLVYRRVGHLPQGCVQKQTIKE